MRVTLRPDRPAHIDDADRLDRLSAHAHGPLTAVRLDPICRPADDDHVWVSVDALRIAAATAHSESDAFDGMIAYAQSKGWLDEARTHVRAHVEAPSIGLDDTL